MNKGIIKSANVTQQPVTTDGRVKSDLQMTHLPQSHIVRLVTRSFVSELVKYGLRESELISVSTALLDHAIAAQRRGSASAKRHPTFAHPVNGSWTQDKFLSMGDTGIRPAAFDDIPYISEWLEEPSVRSAFFTPFPRDTGLLAELFLCPETSLFCVIEIDGQPAGFIGGKLEHPESSRIEMRKLVAPQWRGRGIGTRATRLWLHVVFQERQINKAYLYSLNTNIRNINLNSGFGFELEGILHDEHLVHDRFVDVVRMGLTKARWRGDLGIDAPPRSSPDA